MKLEDIEYASNSLEEIMTSIWRARMDVEDGMDTSELPKQKEVTFLKKSLADVSLDLGILHEEVRKVVDLLDDLVDNAEYEALAEKFR